MNLDKNYGNLLLDFYKDLLTKRQTEVLEYYFSDDYSMQEIAEELNISKSAVSDNIHRALEQLNTYEEKLNLIKDYKARMKIYDQLALIDNQEVQKLLKELIEIE